MNCCKIIGCALLAAGAVFAVAGGYTIFSMLIACGAWCNG